jgi:hypothetical protein
MFAYTSLASAATCVSSGEKTYKNLLDILLLNFRTASMNSSLSMKSTSLSSLHWITSEKGLGQVTSITWKTWTNPLQINSKDGIWVPNFPRRWSVLTKFSIPSCGPATSETLTPLACWLKRPQWSRHWPHYWKPSPCMTSLPKPPSSLSLSQS